MKLVHLDKVVGTISSPSRDGEWMCGELSLEAPPELNYSEFFAFMVDESHDGENPPFSEDFLDEANWQIDDNGLMRGIDIPAVHDDNTIMWRWR